MNIAVSLFIALFLWKLQPKQIVLAGFIGGLLWAVMETTYIYHTLTDMKKLVSPMKLTSTLKRSAIRSVSTFVSRAMLFYAVNHLMSVTHVPVWSYAFGLSFGFYAALTFVWGYHRRTYMA